MTSIQPLHIHRIVPIIIIALAFWFEVVEVTAWIRQFSSITGVLLRVIHPEIHVIYWIYAEFIIVTSISFLYRYLYHQVWLETTLLGLLLVFGLDSIYWIVDYWSPDQELSFFQWNFIFFYIPTLSYLPLNPIICGLTILIVNGIYYWRKY